MAYYNEFQWILVFFIYCVIGWIWETCYVTAKNHFYENRGFLNGPMLPIYGFGACIMLVSSMYVREYPILVFLFGLISATILELFTGLLMEKLFRVKYWNYAHERFNYKGYICLKSSLAWGVASLGLAYLVHRPIDALVMLIPEKLLENIVMIVSVIAAMDFATSFKAAMDLRDILIAADKVREEVYRLQRRAEIIETFISEGAIQKTHEIQEQFAELLVQFNEGKDSAIEELAKIKELQQSASENFKLKLTENSSVTSLLRRNPGAVSKKHDIVLNAYKEKFLEELSEIKEVIAKSQNKKSED